MALTHTPNVAVIVAMSNAYGRDVVRGVTQYIHTYGPWHIHWDYEFSRWHFPPWLKNWHGDGIISRLSCPEIGDYAKECKIPVIDLNEQNTSLGLPFVYNDQVCAGKMAAEHLLERGFKQFAYIGQRGLLWSDQRLEGFSDTIHKADYHVHEFVGTPVNERSGTYRTSVWETETEKICQWLVKLPKPTGILTCNSFRGLQLLELCRSVNIAVPETIAVITADNEEVACELAVPSLSAVSLNGKGIGYLAASLLDKAMFGEDISQTAIYVPPSDILVRNSSRITALADDNLGKALEFIRENARFNITVQDVAKHIGVSVRKIHLLFRNKLNSTVHDRIIACKIETVVELLRGSDLPLTEVAYRSGFNHVQRMSDVFLEKQGMRPGEYRRINR